MNIKYSKIAIKYIEKLDKNIRERILRAIEILPSGDVKQLKELNSEYRLRVGTYRVLFSINGDTIEIDKVAPRGSAYN